MTEQPASPSLVKCVTAPTVVPKPVSIIQLLRAGTLVKMLKTTTLQLEHFGVEKNNWVPACWIKLQLEEWLLGNGAFRYAFKATCSEVGLSRGWVVKKYQPTSLKTMINILKSTVKDHTCKQVQMHLLPETLHRDCHQEYPTLLAIPSVMVRCFSRF